MGQLDGQVKKQSLVDVFLDKVLDVNRAFGIALRVFVASVLFTPVGIYFSFAYFTAKVAPWWLDAIAGVQVSAFLLSGFAILLLGLAKLTASRKE